MYERARERVHNFKISVAIFLYNIRPLLSLTNRSFLKPLKLIVLEVVSIFEMPI